MNMNTIIPEIELTEQDENVISLGIVLSFFAGVFAIIIGGLWIIIGFIGGSGATVAVGATAEGVAMFSIIIFMFISPIVIPVGAYIAYMSFWYFLEVGVRMTKWFATLLYRITTQLKSKTKT